MRSLSITYELRLTIYYSDKCSKLKCYFGGEIALKFMKSVQPPKFIPTKYFVYNGPRKLIPAKCPKNLTAKINSRENFFP